MSTGRPEGSDPRPHDDEEAQRADERAPDPASPGGRLVREGEAGGDDEVPEPNEPG